MSPLQGYEQALLWRNRGVQLVEREEEVCIFYEKLNIQETMIRNGNVALSAMEEEIRWWLIGACLSFRKSMQIF